MQAVNIDPPSLLSIPKSTGYHKRLNFWMSRVDLRKKENRIFLEIRHHETKFGNSEPQTVNLLNLGKFSKDCYARKKRKPGKKWKKKGWWSGH